MTILATKWRKGKGNFRAGFRKALGCNRSTSTPRRGQGYAGDSLRMRRVMYIQGGTAGTRRTVEERMTVAGHGQSGIQYADSRHLADDAVNSAPPDEFLEYLGT